MSLSSQAVIVSGGANLLAPTSIGTLPMIVDVGPPGALSDSIARERDDAGVRYITMGPTNVREGVGATETLRLSDGFISEGAGQDSFIAGRGAGAAGQDGIAIGRGASAVGQDSIAIGRGATANTASSITDVVVGAGSSTQNANGIVIGGSSFIRGNGGAAGGIAIGVGTVAGGTGGSGGSASIAIGNGAQSIGRNDVVIGEGAQQTQRNNFGSESVIIGNAAQANVVQGLNVIIGYGANGTGRVGNVAIGRNVSVAASSSNVVLGESASVAAGAGAGNVIIGRGATLSGAGAGNAVIIGRSATGGDQSIHLGSGGSTPANTASIGASSTNVTTIVFGQGSTAVAAPSARTIRFTDASAVDTTPGAITWLVPRATGAATPAQHVWRGTEPTAPGATLQSLVDWMTWRYGGAAGVFDVLFGRATSRMIPASGGVIQFGDGSTAGGVTFDFGSLGAGIASIRLNGLTNGAGANVGTLNNAPTAGNPAVWVPFNIGGTVRHAPMW